MTEFKRYLDSPATPALDDLLRSALDDAPGPGALGRVARGVGVSTAALSSVGIAGALGAKAAAGSLEAGGLAASGGAPGGSGAAGSGLAGAAGSAAVGLGAGNTLAVLGKTLVVSMLSAGALSAGVVAIHDPSVLSDSNSASQAARATKPHQGPAVAAGDHLPSAADFRRRVTSRQEATAANAEPETADQALPQEPQESAAQRGSSAGPRAIEPPATQPPVTAPLGASKGAQVSLPAGAQRPQSAAPARAAGATTEASRNGSALGLEVKRIDSARRALESKDAPRALAELESYERTREFGVLDREALLLRIQALVQQQRREQAKALAREYLERFPGDTHAPRLRGLLAAGAASVGAFPEE